jgi:DamX protein
VTELTSTAAEPSYIQRLGLSGLPFRGVSEADFFESKSVRHNCLLATHLLRTTHHPIVICGAEGIGKSACLNHLSGQTKEDLRFCRLHASEPDSQLHQCLYRALGLNIEPKDTEEARIKYLKQRLSQLRQLNQVPVLVVDDIDQCSTKNQQQIETCLNWRDEQG